MENYLVRILPRINFEIRLSPIAGLDPGAFVSVGISVCTS